MAIIPRTLYVHIGTHKTGTTSIQAFLRRDADLPARDGVYVPSTGAIHAHAGHHNIAWQLRGDPRFNTKHGGLGHLVDELAQAAEPKAVISSEDFEYPVQYPEALSRFEIALGSAGWVPTYIVFFRHQETAHLEQGRACPCQREREISVLISSAGYSLGIGRPARPLPANGGRFAGQDTVSVAFARGGGTGPAGVRPGALTARPKPRARSTCSTWASRS